MGDNDNANIKCPKESLHKRQFIIHLVFNTAEGNDRDRWCNLVWKGTGKRIKDAEKELQNEDADMFWQSKAWIDKEVMLDIAKDFLEEEMQNIAKMFGSYYFVIT